MYKIIEKRLLADNIYLMNIEASRVSKAAKPGQFVIVKIDEKGERIPLTICDYNEENGTVTIVFQVLGESTRKMSELSIGDYFQDFVGPLGNESDLYNENIDSLKNKNIIFIAGGVGAAPVYPQVKWLNSQGIKSEVIVGSKNKDMLILENELKNVAKELHIITDDGSYGKKGLVTNMLEELVNDKNKQYDLVIAIGPMVMMKFISILTKKLGIKTIVSLNPIMVDGTGMCGACRITIDGKVKFACVDGPEFDGHKVDFDEAMRRQRIYSTEEGRQYLKKVEGTTHHGGCNNCGGNNNE